jgi:YfiH family protein
MADPDWIVPDWPVPAGVRSLVTTRAGGVSKGPYASLNLGLRVEDERADVLRNREILRASLPAEPRWLQQVHGNLAVDADSVQEPVPADASFTRNPGTVCAVMIADCMPVLLADRQGTVVAAAHAGWRGLAAGVVENALASMKVDPADVVAWLGPAIGPRAFEVGADVRDAFVGQDARDAAAFVPHVPGKWMADLFALARRRLQSSGVRSIHGGGLCTHSDPRRFFSHRRDGKSGRMAALIWIDPVDRPGLDRWQRG